MVENGAEISGSIQKYILVVIFTIITLYIVYLIWVCVICSFIYLNVL